MQRLYISKVTKCDRDWLATSSWRGLRTQWRAEETKKMGCVRGDLEVGHKIRSVAELGHALLKENILVDRKRTSAARYAVVSRLDTACSSGASPFPFLGVGVWE